jgi:signal transduction histidine kinase/CheY-like chemotaxis protein
MAIAIAVTLIVLAACGGLIYYASIGVNHITEARETRLMGRSVERRLERLKEDVASVAVWSDAYDFTARRFDPVWAHINYGAYFHQYLHHDVSVVLDAHDRPLYASIGGERVAAAELAPFIDAVRPVLAAIRRQSDQKTAAAPEALAFDRVAATEAAVRVGSRVFLVSASTVVPEPAYAKPLLSDRDPVIISAVEVDADYLAALDEDYGLKQARLWPAGEKVAPTVPLPGVDGAPVAAIGWSPERPGVGVYREAIWPIAAVGLLVLAAVAFMILRMRRLAHEVELARARAEAGDRAKSDFIANMSHEIRTPLNGVLGMAQALEGQNLGMEQRACVKVIRDSGSALLGVLNDMLDLSKIEAGKLEIVETHFRLDELSQGVCANFAEAAAAKDLELSVHCDEAAIGFWTGDAMRIRQVLTNLVSNAVKFTASGSVTLLTQATEGGVRFSAIDTGIGVTEEQIPRLFDRFSQADVSTTRRYGGTGLGLSICRELVALMGGAMEVSSRIGEGSTFSVTLPLTRATAADILTEQAPQSTPWDRKLRVLAAEDNATNQIVLRALIAPLGAELALVENGREAVAAFEAGAFDIVLMDIQMPEMNGLEAARAIRTIERREGVARTPILALTANVMTHQVEAYLAAGMDGHVAKPVDATALYAALEAAMAESERVAA